jgi:K+-sensing histidine kinase KdpD
MDPRKQKPSPEQDWMTRLSQPVHIAELDAEERFAYTHFLHRVRDFIIVKAIINALLVALFFFTVMPDAPGTVLVTVVDGLLLIPYYFLVRRWPAASTITLLTLAAVAVSAADAASGYQTFTSGVFYAIIIVAGAVLLLHPRNIAIITFSVTSVFVATYLLEMTHVIPVQMTLLTPRAILRVMALHVFSFLGLGALSSVLTRLYRQLLLTRSQQDIQRALQEGFFDITAKVALPTMLQRIAERAMSTLPSVDRALLIIQEDSRFIVRGAAGCAPVNPIGNEFPIEMAERLPSDSFTLVTDALEQFRPFLPPENAAQWATLPPARVTFFYPLRTRQDQQILLAVSNIHSAEAFGEAEKQVMNLFVHQAAVAIENAQLLAESQDRLQTEIALRRIGQEIASHLRMPELVPAIYDHIVQVMNASSFLIAVKRPHGNDLQLLSPIDVGRVVPDQVVPSQGVLGWVVRNQRPLRFGDMQREIDAYPDIRIQPLAEGTFIPGSLLAVPLQIGDQTIGALSVQSPRTNAYDERDEHLLTTLANHVAVAVQNARLYEEVQQKQTELQGLIAAMSQRLQDPVEALSGFSHLLKESVAQRLTPEQDDYLQRLERNSHWIGQLNQDMLFLTRLDQIQEELEPIALSTLAQGVVTHLELDQQGIEVVIQPDMPTLYADPVLLWAYFRNVLQNTCRLLQEATGPKIEVGCTPSPEGYLQYVRGNGQTLGLEELQHAYELFFPIGGSEGAGIGLAIARRIAEHYGGRVWAAAATGGGTILNLVLPQEMGTHREDQR